MGCNLFVRCSQLPMELRGIHRALRGMPNNDSGQPTWQKFTSTLDGRLMKWERGLSSDYCRAQNRRIICEIANREIKRTGIRCHSFFLYLFLHQLLFLFWLHSFRIFLFSFWWLKNVYFAVYFLLCMWNVELNWVIGYSKTENLFLIDQFREHSRQWRVRMFVYVTWIARTTIFPTNKQNTQWKNTPFMNDSFVD